METRANYVLIGAFTLAVIAAAFGFVLWFQSLHTTKLRSPVRIIFEGPASGLVMFKRGVVARRLVFEAVLMVLGFLIERGFILRHRGLEVPREIGAASAGVCLPSGATCNADC